MSGVQQTAQALGGAGQSATTKIQAVGRGIEEVLKMFQSLPGADQQKLAQARAMFQQAAQLMISAVPRSGAG